MRSIAILGSTGSIGTQALDLCRRHPDRYKVTALTARGSKEKLFEQVREFRPETAGLTEGFDPAEIPEDLKFCRFLSGKEALHAAAAETDADMVLVSIVGIAGLQGVMDALKAGKQVLLANKEALVTGGHLVTDLARKAGKPLLPVDSEHSAIFQCLQADGTNKPMKILLTASGGPFRTWDKERIRKATKAEALKHPNWNMGAKITVDSASMFNKGLEIMEARWLFDMPEDKIEVVVHPQSIVHSAVVYQDGAVLAQLGEPDMRVPIGYAMAYPERIETGVPAPDLFKLGSLTFEKPDEDKFPALRLARECLRAGGAACTVFNGANEEAVAAFLREEIPFGEIAVRVERALEKLAGLPANCIEDIWEADRLARAVSNSEFRIQNSEL
ncbi:1-deoxy-D-xylulose-5-phosphate reductoisomerase [Aristaeella lactis]|uniref:1-deoxy-D-xylulose 5-phosphate reductoisomerase n=2 Tax=Aristaeella lactis TaxID=3046383 RepID=A0AC61PN50_9FIRM|nr:1-deoxy-D-xylulose-5-phosphate reductoisomerase [Aristaeella lactis]SMC73675.1 1-deoxy-D-xylulose 5-phosphate reductoisomerase [Aristaeella lactis]